MVIEIGEGKTEGAIFRRISVFLGKSQGPRTGTANGPRVDFGRRTFVLYLSY